MTDTETYAESSPRPRRSLLRILAPGSTLVVSVLLLHVGAIFAVLPYVYVSDDAAVCVLGQQQARAEIWLILQIWFSLGVLTVVLEVAVRFLVARQWINDSDSLLSAGLVEVPTLVIVFTMFGLIAKDIEFVADLPPLPVDVKACAHPAGELAKPQK